MFFFFFFLSFRILKGINKEVKRGDKKWMILDTEWLSKRRKMHKGIKKWEGYPIFKFKSKDYKKLN